jgi:hypothetical protein
VELIVTGGEDVIDNLFANFGGIIIVEMALICQIVIYGTTRVILL